MGLFLLRAFLNLDRHPIDHAGANSLYEPWAASTPPRPIYTPEQLKPGLLDARPALCHLRNVSRFGFFLKLVNPGGMKAGKGVGLCRDGEAHAETAEVSGAQVNGGFPSLRELKGQHFFF